MIELNSLHFFINYELDNRSILSSFKKKVQLLSIITVNWPICH